MLSQIRIRPRRRRHSPPDTPSPATEGHSEQKPLERPISTNLDETIQVLHDVFRDASDVVFRSFRIKERVDAYVVYIDGIVKVESIEENVLKPLFSRPEWGEDSFRPDHLTATEISITEVSNTDTYSDLIHQVLLGGVVLIIANQPSAIVLHVGGGTRRSVSEPETESVVRGPREGFTESIRTNTALVRFKLKSASLKMQGYIIGEQTMTNVVLSYLDGVADPKVIQEVQKRLNDIHIDGVLESGYIEEMIEDETFSPFPQLQYTERPDTVAAQLLEGRFAIFVDGTPFVLIGPITFWQMMQASEDYYERYFVTNVARWLRYICLAIALLLPAMYIAITTYHQDMLPTNLVLSIAAARETIPFPAVVEALIMEIAFEALREASVRLPKTVGQAVSILGALVIGQAAVQAGIVSAPIVMVVALTGIASFTIPRFNAAYSIRILRFPFMILAAFFGLFGIIVGVFGLALHLCRLRSFGVPYLSGVAPAQPREGKDIFIRMPWWGMRMRPPSYAHRNRRRMGNTQ